MTEQAANAPVLLRIDGSIAWLTLNRPKVLNVLDQEMALALRDALTQVAAQPGTRVVVLSGQGRAFMAGGDLSLFHQDPAAAPKTAAALIDLFHESIQAIANMPKPVIASLQGAVAGGGMSLALACDLAIAADDLRMTMAYSAIATTPDGGGTWSLPRLVGTRQALALALLNDPVDAENALRLGLVHRVVPLTDLVAETEKLGRRLAQGPTLAYGKIKRLIRESFDNTLGEQLTAEKQGFVASAATRDFREGIAAFFERRPARFDAS